MEIRLSLPGNFATTKGDDVSNKESVISASLTGVSMTDDGVCAEVGIGKFDAIHGQMLGEKLIALGERIIKKSAAVFAEKSAAPPKQA